MPVGVLQILDRVADGFPLPQDSETSRARVRCAFRPARFHLADPPSPDAQVESRSNSIAPMVNVTAAWRMPRSGRRLRRQGE